MIRDFVPHVSEDTGLGFTEMLLRDRMMAWRPLEYGAHYVDLGYDMDGNLVGIRIWAAVAKRKATE